MSITNIVSIFDYREAGIDIFVVLLDEIFRWDTLTNNSHSKEDLEQCQHLIGCLFFGLVGISD